MGDAWTGEGWGGPGGPVSGCRLLFSAVAELARGAMGMEREKRSAQCSAGLVVVVVDCLTAVGRVTWRVTAPPKGHTLCRS